MSMIGYVTAASDAQIEELLRAPDSAWDFVHAPGRRALRLEKSWHALTFLLTRARPDDPLAEFLVSGGEEIGEVDLGYGPGRAFRPDVVAHITAVLASISDDALLQQYAPEEMGDIYPMGVWGEGGNLMGLALDAIDPQGTLRAQGMSKPGRTRFVPGVGLQEISDQELYAENREELVHYFGALRAFMNSLVHDGLGLVAHIA